jgi:hypothetical protein
LDAAIAEIEALNAIAVEGEPIPVEPQRPEHFGKDAHVLASRAS